MNNINDATIEHLLAQVVIQPGLTMRQLRELSRLHYTTVRDTLHILYQNGFLEVRTSAHTEGSHERQFYPSQQAIDWLNNTS